MSTRCLIARKVGDKYHAIYSHWDGFPDAKIPTLKHYNTVKKVDQLLALGNVSALYDSIECPIGHTFDTPVPKYSIFYKRDRGETGQEMKIYNSFRSLVKNAKESWGEFLYVFDDGKWTCYELLEGEKYKKMKEVAV